MYIYIYKTNTLVSVAPIGRNEQVWILSVTSFQLTGSTYFFNQYSLLNFLFLLYFFFFFLLHTWYISV